MAYSAVEDLMKKVKPGRNFASPVPADNTVAGAATATTTTPSGGLAAARDKILQEKYGTAGPATAATPTAPTTSATTDINTLTGAQAQLALQRAGLTAVPNSPGTTPQTAGMTPMAATTTSTAPPSTSGLVPLRQQLEAAGFTVGWNANAPGVVTVTGPDGKSMVVTPEQQAGGISYVSPATVETIKAKLASTGPATGTTTTGATTTTTGTTEPLDRGKGAGNRVKSLIKDNTGKVIGYVGLDDKQYNMDGSTFTGGMEAGVYPTGGTASDVAGGIAADYSTMVGQVRDIANQYFQNQQSYIQQLSAAGLAMVKLYNDQYAKAIALLQGQINRDPQIPESLKLAIAELRKGVAENGKALLETMNARGILRSGITGVELEKLAEMGTQSEQKMLADWLDTENANMTKAVYALADMYAQSAGPMAQMQYQATTAPIQAGMNLGQQMFQFNTDLAQKAYDISSGLRQWTYTQEQAEKAAQAAAEQAQAELQWKTWQALLPYQYMTAAQQEQAAREWAQLDETQRHNKIMEGISQAARAQAADWQQYMRDRNTTADEIDRNTIIAIEGIMDPTVVWDEKSLSVYLANQVPIWTSTDPNIGRPVNFSEILNAIKYKFPNSSDVLQQWVSGKQGLNQ